MTDTLPDDAWVNTFLPTPPKPLHQALQRRLNASQTHINALSELFKQRAAIESQYADSLSKLAKTAEQGGLIGKGGTEWEKSGAETKLWNNVVSDLSQTAAAHSTFSALVRTDFEQPVKELPTKIVPWRRVGDQDSSLDKALKDYEKVAAKLEKTSGKSSKAGKADALSIELTQITSNLSSLSPMVYTTYQRLDEERLRALKEIVVRWGTVRADMAQRAGERAENSVASIISWETPDEVISVANRLAASAGGTAGGSRAPTINSAQSTPRSVRRLSSAATPDHDFSPRPTSRQNGTPGQMPSSSTFAGGLKSMLGRRPTLGPGGRRSESSAASIRSARSRDARFAAIDENEPDMLSGSTAPPVDNEGFSVAPADRHRNPWEDPNELVPTKMSPEQPSKPQQSPAPVAAQLTESPNGSTEYLESPTSPTSAQPKMNLAMTEAPIQESEEERQAAMEKMQQTLQLQPLAQPTRRQTVARGRRDVRNTMFGAPPLDSPSTPLGDGSSTSSAGAPRLEQSSGPMTPLASALPTGNFMSPTANGGPPHVVRQTSMSSVTSRNPFESPGLMAGPNSANSPHITLDAPGLRASMTETVNAVLEKGKVQRLQVNGEIYLSLRSSSPSTGPIHVRLNNFEGLEKIAPNPTFLAQVPEKPGEYFLNSEVLASATQRASVKGTLLFKYQVFVTPDLENRCVPIKLEPAYQCKPGETRMILNYKIGETSAALKGLDLVAAFEPGPEVSSVQTKPAGGVWAPSSRQISWSIGDVSEGGRIIAKFITEAGDAMSPRGVQAKWMREGFLASDLGLEIVKGDLESSIDFTEVVKATTSGKYVEQG